MTRIVPSRFDIKLSLIVLDERNEPVDELPQEPVVVYGIAAARDWLDQLPDKIADAEQRLAASNGKPNEEARWQH